MSNFDQRRYGESSTVIQKIIRSRGGNVTNGQLDQERKAITEQANRYRPFIIDEIPCMSFKIFYYDGDGYLQRPWFYYSAIRDAGLKETPHGVMLSFSADARIVTLRGDEKLHEVAQAMEECTLNTLYVYDKRVWPQIPNDTPIIDRIAIHRIRNSNQVTDRFVVQDDDRKK